nr:unnamed protein product [Callosobruchus analis]
MAPPVGRPGRSAFCLQIYLILRAQQVNPGSPAERAGLVPGDAVIKINNVDVYNLKHKDAQDVVVRAGPAFEMTVQRGGLTWRPSVTPTGHVPAPSPVISNNISPVTRTSLAAPKGDNFGAVGTGHNLSAKPFAPQVNGSLNGGPRLVNKQYNTPVKLYSEDTIAETLAAQSEVLAPGVVGVNFKKNEKNYDASNSAVLRMLKETENEPRTPTEVNRNFYSSQSHAIGGRRTATPTSEGRSNSVASIRSDNVATSSVRSEQHIATSTTKSENFTTSSSNVCETSEQQVGNNVTEEDTVTICTDCERVIVGVFVRIKDKNLHVECFKCSTCGTSLKNVGYYNINNKLYCDIHAKSAAQRTLSTHSLPTPSPLSPKLNNSFASPYQTSNLSGPRPFSSVSGPLSPHNTLPRSTGPISPVSQVPPPSYNTPIHNTPSYSPVSSTERSAPSIIWPPPQEEPDIPTACPLFYPPPSKVENQLLKKRYEKDEAESIISDLDCLEVENINAMAEFLNPSLDIIMERKSATEVIETLTETLETQKLVEKIVQSRPPLDVDVKLSELPKPAAMKEDAKEQCCPLSLPDNICCRKKESYDLKRPIHFSPNTVECELKSRIENPVPQKWESPLTQALRTMSPDRDTFAQIPSKHSYTPLASALTIAPSQPFTPSMTHDEPVPLPEETVPYFPPERPVIPEKEEEPQPSKESEVIIECRPSCKREKSISKFVKALESAPDKPQPLGGVAVLPKLRSQQTEKQKPAVDKTEEKPPEKPKPSFKKKNDPMAKYFEDLPTPQQKLSLSAALTIAPDRPYSPLVVESVGVEMHQNIGLAAEGSQKEAMKDKQIDRSLLTKPLKPHLPEAFKSNMKEPRPPGYYPPSTLQAMIDEGEKQLSNPTSDKPGNPGNSGNTSNPENPGNMENPVSVSYSRQEECRSEEHTEATDKSETTKVERQIIQNPHVTEIITEEQRSLSPSMAPMFSGFTCSFQNKGEHSQFSVEVSTTPTMLTQVPSTSSVIRTIESQPGYVEKQTITEERHDKLQSSKKLEQSKEEVKADVVKQAEEVILKKAEPPVKLHSRENVPSYQIHLQEEAEADLQFMEKIEKAEKRLEQRKLQETSQQSTQQQVIKKPVITVQPEDERINEHRSFKPVVEDRPQSRTFSPRPTSCSPSRMNKPAPILPYYQANLVPQQMPAASSNLLDPMSPAVSRSPSPCPLGRGRSPVSGGGGRDASPSPSPFAGGGRSGSNIRPVSPAQGPPENPMRSKEPLPVPEDSKKHQARENLTTFIPEYKSRRDIIESTQGMDFYRKPEDEGHLPQMYTSTVQTQNFPVMQESYKREQMMSEKQASNAQQQMYESKMMDLQEAQRSQRYVTETAGGTVATSVDEQRKQAHMEQMKKSQSESVERSADGGTQIQRRRVVTEEFEHTQKETNIQIEKHVTRSGFRNVNVPDVDSPLSIGGIHYTNPHPMSGGGVRQQQQLIQQSQASQSIASQQSCCQKSCSGGSTCCQQGTCQPSGGAYQGTCTPGSAYQGVCQTSGSAYQGACSASHGTCQSQATRYGSSQSHVTAQTTIQPTANVPVPEPSSEPALPSAIKKPPGSSSKPPKSVPGVVSSHADAGAGTGRQAGGVSVAPRRGRGVLNAAALAGARIPLCASCNRQKNHRSTKLCHATQETENLVELDEVDVPLPSHPPPPPPVPVYSQINITIPYQNTTLPFQSTSPQLDSIGSSPRSDYSSYSSSSSKNHHSEGYPASKEAAREKIMSEIKNLTPKLKNVNVSEKQSPKMNSIETTTTTKKVTSELFVPINNYQQKFETKRSSLYLPDNVTYSNTMDSTATSKKITNGDDEKTFKGGDGLPSLPICCKCNAEIARGPFITALGKIWCPNHFICATPSCRRPLQDLGFVEEKGQLYCEYCFEKYLAPTCAKCSTKIKTDCLKAIGKNFHPECFNCVYCGKLFGNSSFFIEDGSPYCEADWNELFTTKCFACGFPVEAGDRWVEALNNNYHSQCFNCTMCKKNLEGQSFFAKGGRPFCKNHAR